MIEHRVYVSRMPKEIPDRALVGDRQSPDDWKDAGSLDVRQRANKVVRKILEGSLPTHISPDSDSLIREMFPIHLDFEN